MKTLFLKLIATGLALTLFSGCSSKNASTSSTPQDLSGAPSWVLMPYIDGFITDMGSASANAGGDIGMQRSEAAADARANLAFQIETKVSALLTSMTSLTGSGADATYNKSIDKVSKQIADQTLRGTKIQKMWISPNGTMYVLIVVDTKSVKKQLGKKIKSSFKNDEALYNKFLKEQQLDKLDEELEKLQK